MTKPYRIRFSRCELGEPGFLPPSEYMIELWDEDGTVLPQDWNDGPYTLTAHVIDVEVHRD